MGYLDPRRFTSLCSGNPREQIRHWYRLWVSFKYSYRKVSDTGAREIKGSAEAMFRHAFDPQPMAGVLAVDVYVLDNLLDNHDRW